LALLVTSVSASGGGNLYLVQVPSAPEKIVWTNTAGEWRSEISTNGDASAEGMMIDVNTSVLAGVGQFRVNVRSGNDESATFDVQSYDDQGYAALAGSSFKGLTVGSPSAPTLSNGVGVDVYGKFLRLRDKHTPVSSSAACNTGEIGWDPSYIYVCVNQNTWRRVGLGSW